MEFTNEIFFNKPLTAGSTVIITYCGKLYREHSKNVSIVFGYGDNWAETDNSPMVETENGFEVTLTMKDYNTFNFCFTNSFNIWDNNNGFNYISPILPKQEEPKIEDNKKITDNTIEASSNEDVKPEDTEDKSQEETPEETETKEENEVNEDKTVEESKEENSSETSEFKELDENSDIENAFSSLLDSILDETPKDEKIDVSNLPGFGLQSVDEIKEEDMINCDEIFNELFKELTLDSSEEVSNSPEKIETKEVENEKTDSRTPEVTNYDDYDVQELDSLMDNLLMSISENSKNSEYSAPTLETETNSQAQENAEVPSVIVEKEDWLDKFLDFSYNFSKKVTTAFKKFGTLIKLKAKEYGIINESNK